MKIKSLVVLVLGIALLASCSRPLADRMDKFVTKTEANYEKYSDKDWVLVQTVEHHHIIDTVEELGSEGALQGVVDDALRVFVFRVELSVTI